MHDLQDLQRISTLNYIHSLDSRARLNGIYYLSCLLLIAFVWCYPFFSVLTPLGYAAAGICLLLLLANLVIRKITHRFVMAKMAAVSLMLITMTIYFFLYYAGYKYVADAFPLLIPLMFFAAFSVLFSTGMLVSDWYTYQTLRNYAEVPPPPQKTQDYYKTIYTYLKNVKPDKDPEVFTFFNSAERSEKYRAKIAGGIVAVFGEKDRYLQFVSKDEFSLTELEPDCTDRSNHFFSPKLLVARIELGDKVIERAYMPLTSQEKLRHFLEADRQNLTEDEEGWEDWKKTLEGEEA